MPRRIVNYGQMTTKTIWDRKEWCQRLPEWWLRPCGCQRTCSIQDFCNYIWDNLSPQVCKHLLRYTFASIEGWVVKLSKPGYVSIYPWPKEMYSQLF